jgi:hypothetical protein
MPDFNGKSYVIGDKVIYSVYPEVWEGTGIVTADGVQSTGETLATMTASEIGDTCPWESLYDVRLDGPRNYDALTAGIEGQTAETLYRQTQEPGDFMGALATIADAIGGEVWHSGGGIYGVLVQRPDWECFFGFADDVLGWDIGTPDGDWIGGGITELTIDQTDAVIARCRVALDTKEIQHIY